MGVLGLKKGLERLDPMGTIIQIATSVEDDAKISHSTDRVYIDFLSIIYTEGARISDLINQTYLHIFAAEQGMTSAVGFTPQIIQFIADYNLGAHISDSVAFLQKISDDDMSIITAAITKYCTKLVFEKIIDVKYVFISLDGQVPYGKVKEQRQRRYVTPAMVEIMKDDIDQYIAYGIYSDSEEFRREFDRTKYSFNIGGAIRAVKTDDFMNSLVEQFTSYLKTTLGDEITYTSKKIAAGKDTSDTGSFFLFQSENDANVLTLCFSKKDYGEGEQIIVREVISDVQAMTSEEKRKTKIAFYSPDGDVVFLSLFLRLKLGVDMYTIKDFRINPSPMTPSIYVNQTELMNQILRLFKNYTKLIYSTLTEIELDIPEDVEMDKLIILDFIYYSSIFGNDFLHTNPSVNIWSCIKNLIYIYAYYHVDQIIANENKFVFKSLHVKNDRKIDHDREYIPVWEHIIAFFNVLADFEDELIMDTYLASCSAKKQGYLKCVEHFGSLFTFYHTYAYCDLANAMYRGLMSAVNSGRPHGIGAISATIQSSITQEKRKRILFMDHGTDEYDLSFNMYRKSGSQIDETLDPGFTEYFKIVDAGSEGLFNKDNIPRYSVIDLTGIQSSTTFFSFSPKNFLFVYASVVMPHIIDILLKIQKELIKIKKDEMCAKLAKRLRLTFNNPDTTKRRWDMIDRARDASDLRMYIDALARTLDRNDVNKALIDAQSILATALAAKDSGFVLENIKMDMISGTLPLIDTDIDASMFNSYRNEYMYILMGMPYDFGNSRDEPPYTYRNTLFGINKYVFDYDAFIATQKNKVVPLDSSRGRGRGRGSSRGSFRGAQQSKSTSSNWRTQPKSDGFYGGTYDEYESINSSHPTALDGGFLRLEGDIALDYRMLSSFNAVPGDNQVRMDPKNSALAKSRYITPKLEPYDQVYARYTADFLHLDLGDENDIQSLEVMCGEYISGFTWVFDYYVNFNSELIDKTKASTWVYRFGRSPMLRHIKEYFAKVKTYGDYRIDELDNAYTGTFVDIRTYLTTNEKNLFIYPIRAAEFKTLEEQTLYPTLQLVLIMVAIIRDYAYDNYLSPGDVFIAYYTNTMSQSEYSKLKQFFIRNKQNINTVMIPNFMDVIKATRYSYSEDDGDKIDTFVYTIAKLVSSHVIKDMVKNNYKNDLNRRSPHSDPIIDCRAIPFTNKCHLSDSHFKTPLYQELRFTIDVLVTLLNHTAHTKNIRLVGGKTSPGTLCDLSGLDENDGTFKFRQHRDIFVNQVNVILQKNGSIPHLKKELTKLHTQSVANVKITCDAMMDSIQVKFRELMSEGLDVRDHCLELYSDIATKIRLLYYNDIVMQITNSETIHRVMSYIHSIIDPDIKKHKYNSDLYLEKMIELGSDILLSLWEILLPELTLERLKVKDIYDANDAKFQPIFDEHCK